MAKKIRANYRPWNSVNYKDYHKGRDNKGYYNSSGAMCASSRYKVRIPSLKDSNYTWRHFYELFPYIKNCLINNTSDCGFFVKSIELVGDVYIVRQDRLHNGAGFRVRTMKFKKVW